MKYVDKYNILYKAVKKNDKYYLLRYFKKSNNEYGRIVEVKGKENIAKFIKNNGLKRCDDSEQ